MYRNQSIYDNETSTPKRRRLGTGRIYRRSLEILQKTRSPNPAADVPHQSERLCESPLPCNQIEYLCSSSNNSSSNSNFILDSPAFIDGSGDITSKNFEDSFLTGQCHNENINESNESKTKMQIVEKCINNTEKSDPRDEIGDVFDDMFNSALVEEGNIKTNQNHEEANLLGFCSKIEDSCKEINRSICNIDEQQNSQANLFETKDSFMLDIKETALFEEEINLRKAQTEQQGFYGLPIDVKTLFKTLRNIEKFYDWQEECLNLDSIKQRRNLIYALPTSGGKTLVAEVLMLREVLNRKRNALFILPFVAIVQEKIWALSPFAVQLNFLLEEYAAGKGNIPPKKRRNKNSIYIATIEKGLALVRSLVELGRLDEIGLIVVDELHLIGEESRGGTLEMLLTTVMCASQSIQIVGMSATIGNLPELAGFLSAEVFERHFRPVELSEYVQLGTALHRIRWREGGAELEFARELNFDYSAAAKTLDPDGLGGLVAEVVPADSCLVFCPTKRNCENVAALLCKMQRKEMSNHRTQERCALEAALRSEGCGAELWRCARRGVAFHHAGLAADERALIESAYRSGVVSVLCCTSTLAAGVNLPARRVLVRAPRVGAAALSLAAYRQMAGRAGRAGRCDTGESIIICSQRDWPQLSQTLRGGVAPALSGLPSCADSFILSCVSLGLADTRAKIREMMKRTLLAVQVERLNIDMNQLVDDSLRALLEGEALEVQGKTDGQADASKIDAGNCVVENDSLLVVSQFGNAAIKGCLALPAARRLVQELRAAARALVLGGGGAAHLLFLLTPPDALGPALRVDYRHYYTLYCELDEDCLQTAHVLGLTEKNAIRMMTGNKIVNVSELVLKRFYLALVLNDLMNQVPFAVVGEKYILPRGTLQALQTSAGSLAASALRVAEQLPALWAFRALLAELAPRLQRCAAPDLAPLMELPLVRKARAAQLVRAGYRRPQDVARASPDELSAAVAHLPRAAARHLVSAARMMLIEKVEDLRAEAEDVMDELKV